MGPKGLKRTTAVATALALALTPTAALGKPDAGPLAKNYSLNSVSGDYSPARNVPVPVARSGDPSFQWGDAAAGAGVGLLLSGTAIGAAAAIRRRGHSQPA